MVCWAAGSQDAESALARRCGGKSLSHFLIPTSGFEACFSSGCYLTTQTDRVTTTKRPMKFRIPAFIQGPVKWKFSGHHCFLTLIWVSSGIHVRFCVMSQGAVACLRPHPQPGINSAPSEGPVFVPFSSCRRSSKASQFWHKCCLWVSSLWMHFIWKWKWSGKSFYFTFYLTRFFFSSYYYFRITFVFLWNY